MLLFRLGNSHERSTRHQRRSIHNGMRKIVSEDIALLLMQGVIDLMLSAGKRGNVKTLATILRL